MTGIGGVKLVPGPAPERLAQQAQPLFLISLGQTHDLAKARRDYPHLVFQGNVEQDVLRNGTPDQVREATRRCLAAGGGNRHILNLNHGVDRATPVANFQAYIEAAKEAGKSI